MFLILCALDDLDALAFAMRCRAAGVECTVLTGEALSFAARRSQHLSADGQVEVLIDVPGSPSISSRQLSGVLNRLTEPPSAAWCFADQAERDYATAELYAFLVSALAALPCPVRNRPSPGCLAGPMPHPLALLAAARRTGLHCPVLRLDTVSGHSPTLLDAARAQAGTGAACAQVLMLDGAVLSRGVPPEVVAGCERLGELAGAADSLVGVDFLRHAGRWVFSGFTPLPELAGADETAFRAIVGTVCRAEVA